MQLRALTVTNGDEQLITGRGVIMYLNLSETSGAAAGAVTLWDGQDAGGQSLGDYRWAEGTSIVGSAGGPILPFEHGVWMHKITGTLAGVITVKLCDSQAEWDALVAALSS